MSYFSDFQKYWFAWLMAKGGAGYEQLMAERKQQLFADLQGDLLEIGPGTGVNLRYIPRQSRWRGLEPNPHMHPYLQAEAQRLDLAIELSEASLGHESPAILDNSIDGVISTLVLCSVPDLHQTLAAIYRVLKSGGKFYFIEHVAAPPGTLLRQVQTGIRPLWQIIGDGCQPNRDTGNALQAVGFTQVDYQEFTAPIPIPIVQPHIMGIAVK